MKELEWSDGRLILYVVGPIQIFQSLIVPLIGGANEVPMGAKHIYIYICSCPSPELMASLYGPPSGAHLIIHQNGP